MAAETSPTPVDAVARNLDEAQLRDLLGRQLDFGCRPQVGRAEDGSYTLLVIGGAEQLEGLRSEGFDLELRSPPDPSLFKVGEGDRFADGKVSPRGLRRSTDAPGPVATDYLNTDEVDSALRALAAKYPALTDLIALPHRSIEGRVCRALRIGSQPSADAILFTACAHAREWGGADACVYFATDLLEAYTEHTGLEYGGAEFSRESVAWVVSNLNLVVFPCVNPDGRTFSQRENGLWRKNRNRTLSGGHAPAIGVDLNRNHPFLWDFRQKFDPVAVFGFASIGSDKPLDEEFHGVLPGSEPETQNIHWLLDTFRFTRWYLDIHSFDGSVLYPWADDQNQTVAPSVNFLNPAYDGQRGLEGGYSEYISSHDLTVVKGAAQRVADAIHMVHGSRYVAKQAPSLWGPPDSIRYPVSGSAADYAFSRHRFDCTKGKVYAITLEFGFNRGYASLSFHPPWPEMEKLAEEVATGMMELCLVAAPPLIPPWRAAWRRLFPWQIWDPMVRGLGLLVRRILRFVGINRLPGPYSS